MQPLLDGQNISSRHQNGLSGDCNWEKTVARHQVPMSGNQAFIIINAFFHPHPIIYNQFLSPARENQPSSRVRVNHQGANTTMDTKLRLISGLTSLTSVCLGLYIFCIQAHLTVVRPMSPKTGWLNHLILYYQPGKCTQNK